MTRINISQAPQMKSFPGLWPIFSIFYMHCPNFAAKWIGVFPYLLGVLGLPFKWANICWQFLYHFCCQMNWSISIFIWSIRIICQSGKYFDNFIMPLTCCIMNRSISRFNWSIRIICQWGQILYAHFVLLKRSPNQISMQKWHNTSLHPSVKIFLDHGSQTSTLFFKKNTNPFLNFVAIWWNFFQFKKGKLCIWWFANI